MKLATSPPTLLSDFLNLAKTQRVLIDHVGDSNTMYSDGVGHNGWQAGWQQALYDLGVTYWGTGLFSVNNGYANEASYLPVWKFYPSFLTLTGISGSGTYSSLYLSPEQGGGTAPNDVDPPSALGDTCKWGGTAALATWRPHFYGFLKDAAADTNSQSQMVLDADNPIGMNEALDGYAWYGTFLTADGTGNFRPGWRLESPLTVLEMSAVIDPVAPNVYGMTFARVRKAARNALGGKLRFGFFIPGQGNINGPFFGTYQQVVNPARTIGTSVSTMLGLGGQSAFDLATAFSNTPDATIDHYLNARCQPVVDASQTPIMLVVINTGLNDRVEAGNSIRAVGTNASAAGYIDNVSYIIERLEARWAATGRVPGRMKFLIQVSHVQFDDPASAFGTGESGLMAYRAAANTYANSRANVAAVDWSQLQTSSESKSKDFYATNDLVVNRPHMSVVGYNALAKRLLKQALESPSPSATPFPAVTPGGGKPNIYRDGYKLVIAGDASNETLTPAAFLQVQTVERWIADARAGNPSGVIELLAGDAAEFIFVSPGADNQTGAYLITALMPVYDREGGSITGYIEKRREAGVITNGSGTVGLAGAAAIPARTLSDGSTILGLASTDLTVDTITTTLNKTGTEVDSPAGNYPAVLRVTADGAPLLRVQTTVTTATNGFRVIARRCKGDAVPNVM